MIKAIIFDFDGVIGDTYAISFDIFKTFYKKLTKKQFKDYFNGNIYETTLSKLSAEDFRIFFEKQKERLTKDDFFPLRDVFDKLSKKYELVIVSSNTNKNIEHYLKLGKLDHFFKKIFGATTHKSKVEKFYMVFDDLRMKVEECLFVTDTVGDVVEAKKVNIKTIAVTWGFHDKLSLRNAKPFAIANDGDELLRIIEKS